jgi:hypothetical protein
VDNFTILKHYLKSNQIFSNIQRPDTKAHSLSSYSAACLRD